MAKKRVVIKDKHLEFVKDMNKLCKKHNVLNLFLIASIRTPDYNWMSLHHCPDLYGTLGYMEICKASLIKAYEDSNPTIKKSDGNEC